VLTTKASQMDLQHGLVTATLLTLVVLPSLYVSWFSRAKEDKTNEGAS